MSFLSRLSSLFALKQKTAVKLIALMSVIAFVTNLTPELYRDVASQASEEGGDVTAAAPPTRPTTPKFIFVGADGVAGGNTSDCVMGTSVTAYNASGTNSCDLGEAISLANADATTDDITIVISDNVPIVNFTTYLFVGRRSTGKIILDGVKSAGAKTILRDSSTNGDSIFGFFHLGDNSSNPTVLKNYVIKNFAFTRMKRIPVGSTHAAAITTVAQNTPTTGYLPATHIGSLVVEDNYFGTTDGSTLITDNALAQAIRIFLPTQDTGQVISIRNNNFYNVIFPIQLGSLDSNAQTPANCKTTTGVDTGEVSIVNNTIGSGIAPGYNVDVSNPTEGAWQGAAINICNLRNVMVDGNTIVNSLAAGFDYDNYQQYLGNANRFDTAIYLKQAQGFVRNNQIGGNVLTSRVEFLIAGYGVYVEGNYSSSNGGGSGGLGIGNNVINNITPPVYSQTITALCTGNKALTASGRACGGTAVVLDGTLFSAVSYNYIGNPIFTNWGYGVEIKGEVRNVGTQSIPLVVPRTSTGNLIFKNLIYYNKADGVLVDNIDHTLSSSFGYNCTEDGGLFGDLPGNNCRNSIFQNIIMRNGNYNGTSADMSGSAADPGTSSNISVPGGTPVPLGGIGIDLKASTDTTEQKYGFFQHTGSGTTNDTDISINDATLSSMDDDLGGNGVMNTPIIHGTGSTDTSSSTTEIFGDLSASVDGNYWVEVFAVNCPAEILSTSPTITYQNAANNCDTDSTSSNLSNPERQTFGQGAKFLCAVFVTKDDTVTDSEQWSCKPSDFGQSFNGGLVTSTATLVNDDPNTYAFGDTGPIVNTGLFLPGYPASPVLFSCDLIQHIFTGATGATRCDNPANRTKGFDIGEIRTFIALVNFQGTSEFSANEYINPGEIAVNKQVRTCTTAAATSCNTSTFAENVVTSPDQYIEFQFDITNHTGDAIRPALTDTLPSQFEWVSGSCQVYSNIAGTENLTTGARPVSGLDTVVACSNTGQALSFSGGGTASNDNNRRVGYAMARIRPTTTVGTYTNTATVINSTIACLSSSPCTDTASVTVTRAPNALVTKSILSPDTNPTGTGSENIPTVGTDTLVQYSTTLRLEGITNAAVAANVFSDNFPRAAGVTYEGCKYTLRIDGTNVSTDQPCASNTVTINSSTSAIPVWNGSSLPTVGPNSVVEVIVTYLARVPANALTSSNSAAVLTNTATWNGSQGTSGSRSASTTLTITPPAAQQPVVPTFAKQVRACTGTTVDTCTGAFSETGLSNVAPGSTVEFRFEATSSSGATFAFRDPVPTGITFATSANSCLAYAGIAQLAGTASRPTSGGIPCTLDSSSGTQILTTSNVTIAANQYAYVYALATISSTATGTITNTAGINGNGCSTTVAQCNDPAAITITATNPGQVSIDKQVNPTAVTSSASTQDVTYTIVLTKPNTFAINNANWTDTFPTTPVALSNYTCTSVSVLPAGSQTIACPTTFPPAGNTLFSGTINAAVTSITITYTARVPANAVTTAQSVVNSTTISGSRSTDAVAISQTDTATLTVNPASGGTPIVSLSKRADNGVTTSDRAAEKIYKPGDTVNYTLSMLNSGSSAATGVSLQDLFHSMLKSMTIDALPSGATQSLTTTAFNFGNITVPTGTTPTTVTYHGTIADKDNFDLDLFDLDEGSNPARDDDFYAPKDADIDDDLGTSNNSYRRAENILGAPDNKFVSLGSDGEMTIDLGSKVIVNGSGDDFALRTINQSVDDTDQAGEDLKVSVSQDGTNFKTINPRSGDSNRYDLSKARMSWARYIRLQDESSNVKAKAPGTDIDAICLLNIGVQLPNRVNMTIGSQSAFATEYVTVDVTKVFDKKPSVDNCSEPEPVVIQEQLPPPPPAPLPPAPVYTPTPPPALPKTGAEPLVLVSVVSSLAWVFTRKRK